MKILASDYDGTLNVAGVVRKENLEAIDAWRAAGNLFGIVSGRYLASIREFLDRDSVPYDFLIGNNGAILSDGQGRATECICISPRTAEALLREIMRHEPNFMSASFDEGSILVMPDSRIWSDQSVLIIDKNRIAQVTQVHASFTDPDNAFAAKEACVAAFGSEVRCMMPSTQGIDFNSIHAGKAAGLRRLVEGRGIAPEIILTVGDGENDLDMLCAPDFCGYAMKTSMPVVLERVSRTTESVAALIGEYL